MKKRFPIQFPLILYEHFLQKMQYQVTYSQWELPVERRSQNRYLTDKTDCKSLDFEENHAEPMKLFWIVDYIYKVKVFTSNKFWKIAQLIPEINAWIASQKCLANENLM